MTRSYPRDEARYDYDLLQLMVADGMATFYPVPGVYVVKTEDGTSFAVRPHQVITPAEKAELFASITPTAELVAEVRVVSPMDGYQAKERYDLEDTGPGGVVYDGALELAEGWAEATGWSGDVLAIVRRILDDEDGEYADDLREQIAESRQAAKPVTRRRGWVSKAEEDELLGYFGI